MIGFEVLKILILFMLAIEGALIIYDKGEKPNEGVHTTRRDVYGTFRDSLGDAYRKNNKGLYRPIKPNRGDDVEDDL